VNPLFQLDGQVALVTGASSGLGARFAHVLHDAGASVALAARRADRLDAVADGLDRALTVVTDVAEPGDVERLVAETLDRFGRIDILVNNAGIDAASSALDESLDDFRRVVDVNLVALFHLTQQCARHMVERGSGVVINVASILGLVSAAPINNASYCATKGAVVNLTRELAVQWARKGVRVNALAPGWFPSEMTAEMFDDEAGMAFLRRNCPMARAGEPHELDGALLFLASAASSYMTGQTLVIDGGWIAR
jgi:NAD(P)-dependent dehydrogenase (short-subunit alcohol dehydrogenase family)